MDTSIEIIENTIEEIAKIAKVDDIEYFVGAILDIYRKHISLIVFLDCNSEEIIIERNKIKKEKDKHIPRYIKAFEQNQLFYKIVGDMYNYDDMETRKKVFSLYLEDENEFYRQLAQVNFEYYALINIQEEIDEILKKFKKSKITKSEKEILARYTTIKQLKYIFQFFQFLPLTKKVLETSLSISLYGLLTEYAKINKSRASNIIETMLYQLDIVVNLRLQDIENIYVKVIIDELPIFAYSTTKDIPSQIDHRCFIPIIEEQLKYHFLLPEEREAIEELKQMSLLKFFYGFNVT